MKQRALILTLWVWAVLFMRTDSRGNEPVDPPSIMQAQAAIVGIECSLTPDRKSKSWGLGAIISDDGFILTALHVIEGALEIAVHPNKAMSAAARQRIAASPGIDIKWTDRRMDLAIIQLSGPIGSTERLPSVEAVTSGVVFPAENSRVWVARRYGPDRFKTPSATVDQTPTSDERLDIFCNGSGPSACTRQPFTAPSPFALMILSNGGTIAGFSGGPVLDEQARVVGVISMKMYDGMALAVSLQGAALPRLEDLRGRQRLGLVGRLAAQVDPGARAALTRNLENPPWSLEAETYMDVCPELEALVANLEDLEMYADAPSADNAHGNIVPPRVLQSVEATIDLANANGRALAANPTCGNYRAMINDLVPFFVTALRARNHVGSVRTMWTAARDSLIAPNQPYTTRWVSWMGAWLNPIEAALKASMPDLPFTPIRRTERCRALSALHAVSVAPSGMTCGSPQFEAAWDASIRRVVNASSEDAVWADLVRSPELQARLWHDAIGAGLLDPSAALVFSSGTSQAVLAQRERALVAGVAALTPVRPGLISQIGASDQRAKTLSGDLDAAAAAADAATARLPAPSMRATTVRDMLLSFTDEEVVARAMKLGDRLGPALNVAQDSYNALMSALVHYIYQLAAAALKPASP